ncbi:MAG: hypothetical protein ACLFRB_06830 [Thiohalorhabdus sp.]|uniref:hypothetical protein n=1 Tax=Thiohalorhabdus sp. TaxID=3094134 RepID=UPI003980961D
MSIELAPIIEPLTQIVFAVLLAVATVGVKALAERFGLERDGQLATFLQDAIEEGLRVAERRAGKRFKDADVAVQNDLLAEAVDWVVESAPKAVKRLVPGGREALADKVAAAAENWLD